VVSWLLNLVYLSLLAVLSPWLAYRRWRLGKRAGNRAERWLGKLPRRPRKNAPCVWFQAVSVGEVVQLRPVLEGLRAAHPDTEIYLTTTTTTGYEVARKLYPQLTVAYFPLDFSWAIDKAIQRIRPSLLVLVELELWPNLILRTARHDIPIVLMNGRISEKSFRGYRRLRPLMAALLRRLTWMAVQTDEYADRLRQLGAAADRIRVTGSIKFDRVESNRDNLATAELRRFFGIAEGDRVFIAGSTQSPEEELALDAYLKLRETHPELRLLLVPRHKERFEEVAALVEARGLSLLRRSRGTPAPTAGLDRPVLMLDTLGELSACWGLAEIAFVGGSLTNRGGQNMIEPSGFGAAVLFGPNTQNFRDVVSLLLSQEAARVVRDGADLTESVAQLLNNPEEARQLGRRAQQLVVAQQGATRRTIECLELALASGMSADAPRELPKAA
jgi:3-deoxy-D-manno-octulosonic-acid transferase